MTSWVIDKVYRSAYKLQDMSTARLTQHTDIGSLVKAWRAQKGLSQFQLAHVTGLSQRHVSFIETGRTRPSRPTVLALCRALHLGPPQRNQLLIRAGFLPEGFQDEAPLSLDDIQQLIDQLPDHVAGAVINEAWDLIIATPPFTTLLRKLTGKVMPIDPNPNLLRLFMAPSELCQRLHQGVSLGEQVVQQLIFDLVQAPDNANLAHVITELKAAITMLGQQVQAEGPAALPPFFQVHLTTPDGEPMQLGLVLTSISHHGKPTTTAPKLLLVNVMCRSKNNHVSSPSPLPA